MTRLSNALLNQHKTKLNLKYGHYWPVALIVTTKYFRNLYIDSLRRQRHFYRNYKFTALKCYIFKSRLIKSQNQANTTRSVREHVRYICITCFN